MPNTERIELRDGQWADIRTSPTASQNHAISRIAIGMDASDPNAQWVDLAWECGRQLLQAWHVTGDNGQPLSIADWDDAPADIVDAICNRALSVWSEWSSNVRPLAVSASTSSPT